MPERSDEVEVPRSDEVHGDQKLAEAVLETAVLADALLV